MKSLALYVVLFVLFGCTATKKNQIGTLTLGERKRLSLDYSQRATKIPQGTILEQLILDTAIFLDSTNHNAWLEKSTWAIKIGDYKEYAFYINKAVEIDPLSSLGYRAWTRLFCLRDYQGALDDLDRLDSLTPAFMDYPWGENIYFLRGLAKMQMGRDEEALKAFTTCILKTTEEVGEKWIDVYAFVYRGQILLKSNRIDESIRDFDTALKYYDICPEAYYHKALALIKNGDRTTACENLQYAFEFAQKGYINSTIYRDVFNQLYVSDIEAQIESNCKTKKVL